MGTKAILFTKGEGQNFELYKGKDILKEEFHEESFTKELKNNFSLMLGKEIKSQTIKIGRKNASTIVFEDGEVYDIAKGFRTGGPAVYKKYVLTIHAELTAKEESKAVTKPTE